MRVVLGSDHQLIVDAMAGLLANGEPSANRCTDPEKLLSLVEAARAEAVFLDVEHGAFGWYRAIERLHASYPDILIACVSASSNQEFLKEVTAIGGATRHIERGNAHDLLQFFKELFAAGSVTPIRARRSHNSRLYLSPREREVLRHVAAGAMNAEIAQVLGVSVRTVEFHRANIFRKTGARTVADLTRHAIRTGILVEHNA